jgi:hypothetical protein
MYRGMMVIANLSQKFLKYMGFIVEWTVGMIFSMVLPMSRTYSDWSPTSSHC